MRGTKLDQTTHMPTKKERQNAKIAKERNCEKMCSSLKRVQYVKTATLSAEKDNLDYVKIQNIHSTKHKKGFYHARLLVDNVPMKFIKGSGSQV